MAKKIALPSALPGGLEAGMGMHFGHCECYTIVDVNDAGEVTQVSVQPPVDHAQGGCLAPVMYLADMGVTDLLAGGMGLRPMMGFLQNGVKVFYAGQCATVGQAVQLHLQGALPAFSPENTCRGH